jgi:hypothetical protein
MAARLKYHQNEDLEIESVLLHLNSLGVFFYLTLGSGPSLGLEQVMGYVNELI